MSIQEVIQTINQMQADGIIDRYAIGGAVGATFQLRQTPEVMNDNSATRSLPTSTFELLPSNFAAALSGQLYYRTPFWEN